MPRIASGRPDVLPALVEVFREHGYEGASLALISQRTGLGKGSLYNFFPGGKDEMARAVLTEVGDWFEHTIFEPLRRCADPQSGVAQMLDRVVDYFHSGRRACLVGVFALSSSRDRFPLEINSYFRVWQSDLATALARRGLDADTADALAEETIATLQGALVLARARDEPDIFLRAVARLRARLT